MRMDPDISTIFLLRQYTLSIYVEFPILTKLCNFFDCLTQSIIAVGDRAVGRLFAVF